MAEGGRRREASALSERAVKGSGARIVSADGVGNGDGAADAFQRAILDAAAAYERELTRTARPRQLPLRPDVFALQAHPNASFWAEVGESHVGRLREARVNEHAVAMYLAGLLVPALVITAAPPAWFFSVGSFSQTPLAFGQ
jgi:hypothetical protein